MKLDMQELKRLYENNVNIISHLNNLKKESHNSTNTILISYDLQAGSYTRAADKDSSFHLKYSEALANTLIKFCPDVQSIAEVGVGEATTFSFVLNFLPKQLLVGYGFDLSWSRIKYAQQFMKRKCSNHPSKTSLFVGDMFNIPLSDNSIDVVYTSHTIEPNGGNEAEALKELYRIAKRYVVLLEPSYEFASTEARERMQRLGYARDLAGHARNLGLNVVCHEPFKYSSNPLNPTELVVIEKVGGDSVDNELVCPTSRGGLIKVDGGFYCPKSYLTYPVIQNIPCLMPDQGILTTHMDDLSSNFFSSEN
jgi:ubiquinone/menaquinone biosynthesis C-methylase UbiE/uncharacterized protein YbaR (Trm112 family)